jgi:hypothetical protein
VSEWHLGAVTLPKPSRGAHRVIDGLALAFRLDPEANSIAWLVWHLTRIQDDHLDRIVDRSWDPPVSLDVRLVSVIADDLQHAARRPSPRDPAARLGHEPGVRPCRFR